jgi:hypothetical protein
MQVIIDKTVRDAEIYYGKYLREPSPAGDITISAKDILPVKDINLDFVLSEMKKLGTGGELMVVTHSDPKGFKMPIMKGGEVSVLFTIMDVMLKISEGISRRDAIKLMLPNKLAQAWKDWFKDFDPGIQLDKDFEEVDNWQQGVEQKYNEWFLRQGKQILKLPNPKQDLPYIINLLNDVRKLGFERLELRSCRIGMKEDLKTIARFFGVRKVVGPKQVRTFYGALPKIDIISDPKKFAKLKKLGFRFFQGISIGLKIGENTLQVVATDESQAKTFIQKFISPGFSGSVEPFVIGGLEPVGKSVLPVKTYVFPLEADYKKLLAFITVASTPAVKAASSP